jgi:SWI/SNF-related matrix-associated actin-dependent regulator of chromatin subfamily A member 5
VQVRVFRLITEGTVEERIVECAEMKLRLDALVIQQGRLSDKTKQPDKDFFLGAIRFGAERIFRGTDGVCVCGCVVVFVFVLSELFPSFIHGSLVPTATISDQDIDAILSQGELKTQQFNEKLQGLGSDSLQNFTFDTASAPRCAVDVVLRYLLVCDLEECRALHEL